MKIALITISLIALVVLIIVPLVLRKTWKYRYVTDEYFGRLRMTMNPDGKTIYFEKSIDFGVFNGADLCLENTSDLITRKQYDLFNLIMDNGAQILSAANDFYQEKFSKDLYAEYEVESITINDLDDNKWELVLVKKGHFINCVIDMDFFEPYYIAFRA